MSLYLKLNRVLIQNYLIGREKKCNSFSRLQNLWLRVFILGLPDSKTRTASFRLYGSTVGDGSQLQSMAAVGRHRNNCRRLQPKTGVVVRQLARVYKT